MVFGLFSKKCPYCKSKIKCGGVEKDGGVFCCPNCVAGFEASLRGVDSVDGGCCGGSPDCSKKKKVKKKSGCCG